ncbi:STAS domain-containing protein [Rubinisphaera sp. JC750]|uniref:STAS domain-containing protein n=1 Tax=Rubinisphaera sp. JC750 TaxID=2898658 RepID=UPI001F3AE9A0|nr:STAS domain-containing protein [Rubinisphaera sp. JC750]
MAHVEGLLTVYKTGELTVVGFGGHDSIMNLNLAQCRDELITLIQEHDCKTLAFDLTGVKVMPSGTLGLMAAMRKLDVDVHVYNPSVDVREVLEITKLDSLIHVHEIEIPNS